MSDLISRQAALEAVEKAATKECARWAIQEIPPVEVVPHSYSHWISSCTDFRAHNESETGFLCSVCKFGDFGQFNHGGKYTPNYCPNCGARMDGERMTIKEAVNQLESLRADAMERIDPEDEDDVFKKDVEALDKAIAVLQFGVYARGE